MWEIAGGIVLAVMILNAIQHKEFWILFGIIFIIFILIIWFIYQNGQQVEQQSIQKNNYSTVSNLNNNISTSSNFTLPTTSKPINSIINGVIDCSLSPNTVYKVDKGCVNPDNF